MKILALGNHLTPFLLAACGVLLVTLAVQSGNMVQTDNRAANNRKPVGTDQAQKANFTAPGLAAFSEITERPLFRQDRQPPPEVERSPTAARTLSPLRLQLEGVAITPESSIAVMRDLSNNKTLHLAKGMKHQGWELTEITDTVATFTRGAQNQEFTLKKDKN